MATTTYSSWSQANKTYTDRHYRAWLTYNVTTTDTTVTATVYSGVQIDKSISATFTGTQSATGYSSKSGSVHLTFSSGATNQTGTMVSTQTYSWQRVANTSSTKSLSSTAKSTESGFRGDTVSAMATVSVPALPTYTITYNANGGSGAPSSQTKTYGVNAIIATPSNMSRTGYTFLRWNTAANGTGTNYSAGATYTSNANLTLYAVWQINTYQVKYNANGGTGSIAQQTKTYGVNLTLSNGAGFTRELYNLDHWNTASDNTGNSYALSEVYQTNAALNLHAIWSLAYVKPTISDITAFRVSSATPSQQEIESGGTDDGQYIYVLFDWVGGSTDGGESHIAPHCDIAIGGNAVRDYTDGTLSTTPFSDVFGPYSADSAYAISVKIYDPNYTQGVSKTASVSTATYPIDLLVKNNAVSMGIMTPAVAGQALKILVDAIYPVGSYYETSDTTFNPNTYFGGTWSLEAAGQVHVSAGTGYSVNGALTNTSDGGEATHTLTPSETALRTHTHSTTIGSHSHYPNGGSSYYFVQTTGGQTVNAGGISGSGTRVYVAANTGATTNWRNTTSSTDLGSKTSGGVTEANGSAHNNMPPYIVVNRWHRTA